MEAKDAGKVAGGGAAAQPETTPAVRREETIEERAFAAALICLEGHFTQTPPMGPLTTAKVVSLVNKTLEKTHICRKSREALSCNVAIWIWLTRIFAAAIPTLTTRSVGPISSLNDPDKGVTPQESTALIVMNHASIKEDLGTLIKLMHIARNMLVNAEPVVPQDICAAVHFDQMVYQTIILCVNVTSKGYDGEMLDDVQRQKLGEITEHYKKLLVTSLQQAHNWTSKHDRNKMSFWFDVLFDDDDSYNQSEGSNDGTGFRPELAKQQTQHWLDRNSRMCDAARALLKEYSENHVDKQPGHLAPIRPLAWNWLPPSLVPDAMDQPKDKDEKINPVWNPDEPNRFEQDRAYGRVSREIDTWWLRARDPNHDGYVIGMPTIDVGVARLEHCKQNILHRHTHSYRGEHSPPSVVAEADFSDHDHCPDCHGCRHDQDDDDHDHSHELDEDDDHAHHHEHDDDDHNEHDPDCPHHGHHLDHHHHHHDYEHDYADELLEDDEADDDDCYGDGPLTGLLTEIPNILDPKQIEALHMIIKSCILDNAGSGLTRAGENLQKTRCRMLLGLESGRSLLREMLVFLAVWEKEEQSLVYQVTTQIVEAIHHSALVPYTWSCLRIPKDIISPAQTVLLRLVNHMFRARVNASPTPSSSSGSKDTESAIKDIKLVHFFFAHFRTRIVPECAALMHIQTQIRERNCEASEFPVDNWDMERARDGLSTYLDFLTTAAEIIGMRVEMIKWEAIYDLVVILNALETAVPKKQLVELPPKAQKAEPLSHNMVERPYSATGNDAASPTPPPPPQEPAYHFPWAGIKGQIFTIIATMLQPPPGRSSPGNPAVQKQIVQWNGIVPLLNSCVYDDHNPFAKERVTICLKWLLDGCETANKFIRELVTTSPDQSQGQSMAQMSGLPAPPLAPDTSRVRVDGINGQINVRVQPNKSQRRPNPASVHVRELDEFLKQTASMSLDESDDDFMA